MFGVYPESNYELADSTSLHEYLFGGCGVVTLHSPTGEKRTYKVSLPRHDKFEEGTYFIDAQLSNKDWVYVGMIHPQYHGVRRTTHSRFDRKHPIFKGAEYLYSMAVGDISRTPMKVYHEGTCCVCGRKLTTLKSLQNGMGPTCRRKLNAQRRRKTI